MATTADGTRKKTRKQKQTEQTAALVALTENGLSRSDAGKVLGLTKAQVDERLDDSRLELQARAREYVDLHLIAARKAAEMGKAEPAQWALERLGVVKPEKDPGSGGGGPAKTVIQIGIALPGLAPNATPVIEVRPDGTAVEA